MRERESFNVRRREARFAGVGQEGRKTFEENDKVSGREMVIENEGKRVQVRERRQNSKSRQVTTKRGWRVLAKEAVWGGTRRGRGEGRRMVPWREPEVSKLQNSSRQSSAGVRTTRFYGSSEQV